MSAKFRSTLAVYFIFLLVLVPAMDQNACSVCGPIGARTVGDSLFSKGDVSQDGSAEGSKEAIQCQSCVLHVTPVCLTADLNLPTNGGFVSVDLVDASHVSITPASLFHPPTAS